MVFFSAEFWRIEQGSSSILAFFVCLKDCGDRLAELGFPITDRDQILNMFRGPQRPILMMQTPFPAFPCCCTFLLLKESRLAADTTTNTALHVARVPNNNNTRGTVLVAEWRARR